MGFLSARLHIGAAALLLAASVFLSRLMGLARDKIISWQFGASQEADMYFAAFVVPDIINYLLAGGFMSITIIPILARRFHENEEDAWKFFSCVLCWMAAASFLFTMIGEIWASPLAKSVAPGFSPEENERLAFFMRLILPGQIFFLTGASFTALLLLRRQFSVPALSPLIYNGCIIAAGLLIPLLPHMPQNIGMAGYCIGVSIGAFLGALLLPGVIAFKNGIKFRFIWWHPLLKKFLIIALPLMLGQTVVMLDEQFMRVFGSFLGEGNISFLNYARRIAQVPISLMGQAIAVASYPFLVKLLADHNTAQFNNTLNNAITSGIVLIIPCAAFMISASLPILGIIFEGGRFGAVETFACAPLTRLMLAAAPLWIIYMVVARGFYAHEDTLTPAVTGTIVTVIFIPIYYFCALPLGAWAIAACSGLAICAYVLWLMGIWARRHTAQAFTGLGNVALRALAVSILPALLIIYTEPYALALMTENPSFLEYLALLCYQAMIFLSLFMPLALFFCPEMFTQLKKFMERA